jgi:hypothetical protein
MNKKIDRNLIIFYGIIVFYAILIISLSYKLNIWEDESYSLHTTSNNLWSVIKQSYNFEGQPPVYFILLALWRHIYSGIFFARLLSIIFIALSAIYFYRLVRLVSGPEFSKWILILFLLNPFTVWAALEIRLYALAIFLSTILIYYFLRFYVENKNKYLFSFLLISLVGLYTQYFFVFEITALALSILLFKGWNDFFKFCLFLLPVVILFIPNLFFVLGQVKMIQIENPGENKLLLVLHAPQTIVLGLEMIPINIIINRSARIIFTIISLFAYYKLYRKQQISPTSYFRKIDIILLTLGITILLYMVIIPAMNISFNARYIAITLPMFMLIFTLFKEYTSKTRNVIFTCISLYYITLLFLNYKTPIKRYDFKSVSIFLSKNESPKEPILLYNKLLLPPFLYYNKNQHPLNALPSYKFDDKYYDDNIYDTSELKKAIKEIYTPTNSYLLMTGDIKGFKYPVKMTQEMIDTCLKTNFNVTLDTSFSGSETKFTLRIRRLEIKTK